MKYAEDMPAKGIAEHLGKSVGAVEMTLTRTRRALRDCIHATLIRADRP
jgi:DNA-directed RNA polymerase specialized sigma24 family protein